MTEQSEVNGNGRCLNGSEGRSAGRFGGTPLGGIPESGRGSGAGANGVCHGPQVGTVGVRESQALHARANALARQGDSEQALALFRRAIELQPEYPELHNDLGVALAQQGQVEEAVQQFQEALRQKPEYPEALNNLANLLRTLGRFEEAVESYRRALAIRPDYPDASKNLGNALAEKDRLDEAITCYRAALRYNPGYAEVHNNLANALVRQGRFEEAIASYRRALQHSPTYTQAYNNLGNALADDGRLAEAVACYHEAIRLNPEYPEAYNNLGVVLDKQARHAEAGDAFREAVRLRPDYAEAHLNRALGWIQAGQFEQGWAEYEWRWRSPGTTRPQFPQPHWGGEPLAGRTILLYAEQGLGDTFQFIRYAALLKRRGAKVIFDCQPSLVPLLSSCAGIDRLVARGSPLPEFHTHCGLMSLPWLMRTTLATVPADVPYLQADPALVTKWRHELAPLDGYRIGLSWQGNPRYKGDRHRSIPLEKFAPLAELPGARLISLQKGLGTEQLAVHGERLGIVPLGDRLDEAGGAFMDTAAVLMNLNLLITSDTAIAHLAGALGVPTWVPVTWTADWRWLERRADCPWYPTMRLFRQPEHGDWDSVFRSMAEEIRSMLEAPQRDRPIVLEIGAGELVDKLTILEVKAERIRDPEKLSHVRAELAVVQTAYAGSIRASAELDELARELKSVNERLWDVEDEIRLCERDGDFGPHFVELAREVYRRNDHRAALKRRFNQLLGSHLVEEKSYAHEGAAR